MNDEFDHRIAALKRRFQHRAARERGALQRIIVHLEGGASGAQLRAEIQQLAHSLAGAGGTLGFPVISACASALEDLVSGDPNFADLFDACQALVSELKSAA